MERRRGVLSEFLFNPYFGGLALLVVVLSFVLDGQGGGIPCCFSRVLSNVPCPGCGLTRSCVAFAHGDLLAALSHNPAGLLIYPVIWWMALFSFFPRRWQRKIEAGFVARERLLLPWVVAFFLAFLCFGLVRSLYYSLSGVPYL